MDPVLAARRRGTLAGRSCMLAALRDFFRQRDYLEVETPHRIPAPAPETHIDAPAAGDWFLHTSPELCMKRLLAAGFPRLFQICRCFRQGERGGRHLPEFTLLEWYAAGMDYRGMMVQTEQLVIHAAAALGWNGRLSGAAREVDLTPPWPRLTVEEAFRGATGLAPEDALAQGRFDELMALAVEPALDPGRPVFLTDYPAACGALARLRPDNPRLAERFELYIGGLEICNAFSELTDAAEQRSRFEAEQAARRRAGKPPYPLPEPFLRDLSAMPPAAGNALGVDRLAMLLLGAERIDEVVAFTPEEL